MATHSIRLPAPTPELPRAVGYDDCAAHLLAEAA